MAATSSVHEAEAAAAAPSTTARPIASFFTLPNEIQANIVGLACASPKPWLTPLDKSTTFALMLTSIGMYSLASASLYRSVTLEKPSQLAALARTLQRKPALGALIRSLHVGPEKSDSMGLWPLWRDPAGYPSVFTTLRDRARLPRWCEPVQRWALNRWDPPVPPRDMAVYQAVQAVKSALRVRLLRDRRTTDGRDKESAQWLFGAFEVQAALDLYLIELRRLEDEAKVSGSVAPLPTLEFTLDQPLSTSVAAEHGDDAAADNVGTSNTFSVAREDLLNHLARRCAAFDDFNHPLLLVWSSLCIMGADGTGHSVHQAYTDIMHKLDGGSDARLLSDVFARCRPSLNDAARQRLRRLMTTSLFSSTTNVDGGVFALARTILDHAPRLEHLSFSSYLQLLFARDRVKLPSSLRSFGLGPLPHCNDSSLCPSFLALEPGLLANFEELHLTGPSFVKQKVRLIAALPHLKKVKWTMVTPDGPYTLGKLVAAIEALQHAFTDLPRRHTSRRVEMHTSGPHFAGLRDSFGGVKERDGWRKYLSLCRGRNRLYVLNVDSKAKLPLGGYDQRNPQAGLKKWEEEYAEISWRRKGAFSETSSVVSDGSGEGEEA